MAAPIQPKYLSGVAPTPEEASYSPPAIPMDQMTLTQAILQLQSTVNEIIVRVNALATATTNPGDAVTGDGAAASNLFTAQ